ncbi:MAG: heavy-metal-associated domain-containing protein [Candidatus Omnitrophica bacterium]|nr:heavy-metal-associated domain-containing protein [Candidatus Omnitrophota bacterium]
MLVKTLWTVGIVALVFLNAISFGQAEIEEVKLEVDGLACPFCAYGLEKKLKKVPGTSAYEIDMKRGEAFVRSEKKTALNFASFENAVREAGFTLRGITVKAVGKIVDLEEGFAFEVRESGQRFLLFEGTQSHEKYHAGEKIKPLSKKLENELSAFKDKGIPLRIEGTIHPHEGLAPGLLIKRYEEVKA